ncbi:hypothetical protein BD310DRAFT_937002 [Dichomitus squalens]|uniref:Uncharacterized protein n=1 Tax=Dichomitus squalens TaxID=114155 RepID=A0A4Q9PIR0_9APHY|nr:hypothetical protein BD310DRAFT_937002 [Dichomitus squalens]
MVSKELRRPCSTCYLLRVVLTLFCLSFYRLGRSSPAQTRVSIMAARLKTSCRESGIIWNTEGFLTENEAGGPEE